MLKQAVRTYNYLKCKESKRFLFIVFVFLGALCLPFFQNSTSPFSWIYDFKRLAELVVLVIVLFVIALGTNSINNILGLIGSVSVKYYYFLIIVMALLAGSLFKASHFMWALIGASTYAAILFAIIYISSIVISDKLYNIANIVLVLIVFYVFLYSIKVFFLYIYAFIIDIPVWPGNPLQMGVFGFSNKRIFNQTQTWTLPMMASASILFGSKGGKVRSSLIALLSFWWMLVFASGARGTFVAVVFSVILCSVIFKFRAKKWAIIQVESLFAGLFLYFLFFYFLTSSETSTISRLGVGSRWHDWSLMVPDILSNPFIGHGPMQFSLYSSGFKNAHPHNAFLLFSYEWGLLPTLLLSGMVLLMLYKFVGYVRIRENLIAEKEYVFIIGIFSTLVAVIVHSMVSGIAVTPLSQIWFILIVGAWLGIYFQLKANKSIAKPIGAENYLRYAISAISGVVLFFMLYAVYPSLSNLNERQESFKKNDYLDKHVMSPRFWQQGYIGID